MVKLRRELSRTVQALDKGGVYLPAETSQNCRLVSIELGAPRFDLISGGRAGVLALACNSFSHKEQSGLRVSPGKALGSADSWPDRRGLFFLGGFLVAG